MPAYAYLPLHKDWSGQIFIATTPDAARKVAETQIRLRYKGRLNPVIVFDEHDIVT